MEKNAQVGDLVQQRQDARIALEHLKLKGKKIATAYCAFGYAQDRWCVDDATGRGSVFLLHPKSEERDHPQYLLGQADLAEHVKELGAAEASLAGITTQLVSLGITD